jgi:hypothetical protein
MFFVSIWAANAGNCLRNSGPADPAGVSSFSAMALSPDGNYYAHGYRRSLSELYTVDGLR